MKIPVQLPDVILPPATSEWAKMTPVARSALFAALGAGPFAVGLFDAEERLVYSNKVFREGWAIDEGAPVTFESMIRNCFLTHRGAIIGTHDIDAWLQRARTKRREGATSRSFEVDLWDGRWMWVSERRLEDGWLLFIAQDITPLKRSERSMRLARDAAVHASLTDPLTELPNRRKAMQILQAGVERGEPFQIGLIDIDNFKQINDRYGHAVGDEVLIAFSKQLLELQPQGMCPARLAGDEFLVVGPSGGSEDRFANALRCVLIGRGDRERSLPDYRVSIGAASYPTHGGDVRQLLMNADKAMYQSKTSGRCTLNFFQQPTENQLDA